MKLTKQGLYTMKGKFIPWTLYRDMEKKMGKQEFEERVEERRMAGSARAKTSNGWVYLYSISNGTEIQVMHHNENQNTIRNINFYPVGKNS